jgi:hypothetical protein
MVGVSCRWCVFMDEMECFESWSFYVAVDAMRVCVVDADDHVSSCLGGVFLLAFVGGLTGRVLVSCSLLVCF